MDTSAEPQSKPSEPHSRGSLPDLAVFVNLDMLITDLLSFEFIECLRGTGTREQ